MLWCVIILRDFVLCMDMIFGLVVLFLFRGLKLLFSLLIFMVLFVWGWFEVFDERFCNGVFFFCKIFLMFDNLLFWCLSFCKKNKVNKMMVIISRKISNVRMVKLIIYREKG